jgi:hypothetical protein
MKSYLLIATCVLIGFLVAGNAGAQTAQTAAPTPAQTEAATVVAQQLQALKPLAEPVYAAYGVVNYRPVSATERMRTDANAKAYVAFEDALAADAVVDVADPTLTTAVKAAKQAAEQTAAALVKADVAAWATLSKAEKVTVAAKEGAAKEAAAVATALADAVAAKVVEPQLQALILLAKAKYTSEADYLAAQPSAKTEPAKYAALVAKWKAAYQTYADAVASYAAVDGADPTDSTLLMALKAAKQAAQPVVYAVWSYTALDGVLLPEPETALANAVAAIPAQTVTPTSTQTPATPAATPIPAQTAAATMVELQLQALKSLYDTEQASYTAYVMAAMAQETAERASENGMGEVNTKAATVVDARTATQAAVASGKQAVKAYADAVAVDAAVDAADPTLRMAVKAAKKAAELKAKYEENVSLRAQVTILLDAATSVHQAAVTKAAAAKTAAASVGVP